MNDASCSVGLSSVRRLGVAVVLLGLAGGCNGSGRLNVSGAVLLDGQPLEDAAIHFAPLPGVAAPSSGGAIQQGSFALHGSRGLMPGAYRVEVIGVRLTGRTVYDAQMGEISEVVPLRINERPEVEVRPKGDNHFRLQFTSAKS